MGAAFFAPGEAFVHAVTIRLIGNDEDPAVGGGGRDGKQEGTGQESTGNECGGKSHGWHRQGRGTAVRNRPKVLIMINHEAAGAANGGVIVGWAA